MTGREKSTWIKFEMFRGYFFTIILKFYVHKIFKIFEFSNKVEFMNTSSGLSIQRFYKNANGLKFLNSQKSISTFPMTGTYKLLIRN